jgi:hypothetical protein
MIRSYLLIRGRVDDPNTLRMSKQYLEEFLSPFGVVQRQYEIPGEPKYVDVWFVPDARAVAASELGLLGQMIAKPCLFEPYRNVPSRTEVPESSAAGSFDRSDHPSDRTIDRPTPRTTSPDKLNRSLKVLSRQAKLI